MMFNNTSSNNNSKKNNITERKSKSKINSDINHPTSCQKQSSTEGSRVVVVVAGLELVIVIGTASKDHSGGESDNRIAVLQIVVVPVTSEKIIKTLTS